MSYFSSSSSSAEALPRCRLILICSIVAHLQPRFNVELLLSVIALLANFATFEDWLEVIFKKPLGTELYSRVLHLISNNSFNRVEYGKFLQYSSLLIENTLVTPFSGLEQLEKLLVANSSEALATKLLVELQAVSCFFLFSFLHFCICALNHKQK